MDVTLYPWQVRQKTFGEKHWIKLWVFAPHGTFSAGNCQCPQALPVSSMCWCKPSCTYWTKRAAVDTCLFWPGASTSHDLAVSPARQLPLLPATIGPFPECNSALLEIDLYKLHRQSQPGGYWGRRVVVQVCCISISLVSWPLATVEEGGHNVRLLTLQPVATTSTEPKGLQIFPHCKSTRT